MKTKVEGILLTKLPYKERDIVSTILLRNGKKISVLFYGGQGGGKNKKSSVLEVGFLLNIELNRQRKNSDLYTAKEWQGKWFHHHIRSSFEAFSILSFFLELSKKISPNESLFDEDENDDQYEGIFRVLSNGIFYLEKALENKEQSLKKILSMYAFKLLFELGVSPNLSYSVYQELTLDENMLLSLNFSEGGFEVVDDKGQAGDESIYKFLVLMRSFSFSDFEKAPVIFSKDLKKIIDYMFFQFGFSKNEFKSYSFLSSII